MAIKSRLVIAFGPGVDDRRSFHALIDALNDDEAGVRMVARDFHADALDHNPDPFASRHFGMVVRTLLNFDSAVVMDPTFEDPRRRAQVAQAFSQVLPALLVEEMEVPVAAPEAPAPVEDQPSVAPAAQGIVVDDDVYGLNEHYASNEGIRVIADAETEMLVAALTNARGRMMSVGGDGLEYDDVEEAWAKDVYTPNWGDSVEVDEHGAAGFYIDCKSAIEPPMAATFRRILVEELLAQGITRAHVQVPPRD